MCTIYVSSLVQDLNAKVLSHEQKLKHANIDSRLELMSKSWYTQN